MPKSSPSPSSSHKKVFSLHLNTTSFSFHKDEIPNFLPEKSRKFFEELITDLNNNLKDERSELLSGNKCQACLCYCCAFTIIGLIPCIIWKCKQDDEYIENIESIHRKMLRYKKSYDKHIQKKQIVIELRGKEPNYYFEITLFKLGFDYDENEIKATINNDIFVNEVIQKQDSNNENSNKLQNQNENKKDIQNLDCQYVFANNLLEINRNNLCLEEDYMYNPQNYEMYNNVFNGKLLNNVIRYSN